MPGRHGRTILHVAASRNRFGLVLGRVHEQRCLGRGRPGANRRETEQQLHGAVERPADEFPRGDQEAGAASRCGITTNLRGKRGREAVRRILTPRASDRSARKRIPKAIRQAYSIVGLPPLIGSGC
jgi:hypothetical protein